MLGGRQFERRIERYNHRDMEAVEEQMAEFEEQMAKFRRVMDRGLDLDRESLKALSVKAHDLEDRMDAITARNESWRQVTADLMIIVGSVAFGVSQVVFIWRTVKAWS